MPGQWLYVVKLFCKNPRFFSQINRVADGVTDKRKNDLKSGAFTV